VPTPFNHIVLAETLLQAGKLPPSIVDRLRQSRQAFLLGNTAPDLGGLAGRPRAQTHFFHVPMYSAHPAHLRLLDRHPELDRPNDMHPDHAAFVAGYLSHIWVDQLWIRGIFQPYFASVTSPSTFRQRLTDHNLLRAHLDRLDRTQLPTDLGDGFGTVQPNHWLGFAPDSEIINWRDHLADQLGPEGHYRTEEVFARRLGIPAQKFKRQLDSETHMRYILHKVLPNAVLVDFNHSSLDHMAELLQYYLEGRARSAPTTSGPVPTLMAESSQRPGEDHAHPRAI
jgi:hypothetical protein